MTDPRPRGAPRTAVVLVWAVSAVLAGTAAWWAVAVVGSEQGATNRDQVLSQSAVEAALDARMAASADPTAPPPSAAPNPTPTATPTPPKQDPAPIPEVVRTWAVPGGLVGAACVDAQITLLFATPVDGWSVEVKNPGPEGLDVEFTSEETETKVVAACVSGVPQMQAPTAGD